MRTWALLAAALLLAPAAGAQLANNTTDEEPVEAEAGRNPVLILAIVLGVALLIGVIVAVMGRR